MLTLLDSKDIKQIIANEDELGDFKYTHRLLWYLKCMFSMKKKMYCSKVRSVSCVLVLSILNEKRYILYLLHCIILKPSSTSKSGLCGPQQRPLDLRICLLIRNNRWVLSKK